MNMSDTSQENPIAQYYREREERIQSNKTDSKLIAIANEFIKELAFARYSANFSWLGRPIIQIPQDLVALQEIIWSLQPDVILKQASPTAAP